MTEPITHSGGCHCGAVRYEASFALDEAMACNCSICQKRGSLLAFVPEKSFELKSGADALTEYLFNKHVIRHQFCRTCGILPFAKGTAPDGTTMVAINVRTLDKVDIGALTIRQFDGRSM